MKTIISKISKLSYYNNKLGYFEPSIYSFTKYNFSSQKLFNRIYPQVLNVKKSNVSPILNRKTQIKHELNNKQKEVKSSESINDKPQNQEHINKVNENEKEVIKSNGNESVNKKPKINRFSKRRRILRIEKIKSKSNKMFRRSFKIKSRIVEELDKSEKLKIKQRLENKLKPKEVKEEVVEEKSAFGKIKDKISTILSLNKTETEEKPKVTKDIKPIPLKAKKIIHNDLKSKLNDFKESGIKNYERLVENSKISKKNTKLSKYRRQLLNFSKINKIKKDEKEIKMQNLNNKIFPKREFKYYISKELEIDHYNREKFLASVHSEVLHFEDNMKVSTKEQNVKTQQSYNFFKKLYELSKKINSTLDKNEIEEIKLSNRQMSEISKASNIKKSQIIKYNEQYLNYYIKWYCLNKFALMGVNFIPTNIDEFDALIRKHMRNDKHYREISRLLYERRQYVNKNLRINNKIEENNEEYYKYYAKKMFKSESDYILI